MQSTLHELIVNLHLHTIYSDGSATHLEMARIALKAGLDAIIVTDHNVFVQGLDGYQREGNRQVLLLVGEEVHDQDREPQKNHLLVLNAGREMATLADDPQILINGIRKAGGLSFIAHPVDPELAVFNETDISWEAWDTSGFTGIELWNGFSELKSVVRSRIEALPYAYHPEFIARGPHPEALRLWDKLLAKNQRVVAVGGSDAHARRMSMGPLHRTIFPYEYHFSAINTHLIVSQAFSGDLSQDRSLIYSALEAGHAFIGYDLPAPTRGFRFSAQGKDTNVIMGDEISLGGGVTLQVRLPKRAECRFIRDGEVIQTMVCEAMTHLATEKGVYRVEVSIPYLGRKRGWIFSNPIYIR